MMVNIEKVIALKTVAIFSRTPDEVLADIARVTEEIEVGNGEVIIEKGEAGDCLYILVAGSARVHDGDRAIESLGNGDVFGEIALLDPGPRTASVTATEDTVLLRLDQSALYELMEDRPEISRGIIQVLSRRLRERMNELNRKATLARP